jgi:hypothetical protein
MYWMDIGYALRWPISKKCSVYRKVHCELADFIILTGAQLLNTNISLWRRYRYDESPKFSDGCTLPDLALFTQSVYLDAPMQLNFWCTYNLAYIIMIEGYLSQKQELVYISNVT